jgi:hypothetical protein
MEALQSTFGDAFTTLPLLIMGFIFFLGALTSNIGLLYLFIGHLIIVPALSYLGNQTGHPFYEGANGDQFSITGLFKWLFSLAVFFGINTGSLQASTNSISAVGLLFGLIPAILQVLFKESFLHFYNPLDWKRTDGVRFSGIESSNTASPACNIVPTDDGQIYNSPSHWVNHIVFFFGFILSNTIAVYSEPTPPRVSTGDTAADEKRNAQIDQRVGNRKSLALSIAFVSTLVFLVLLFFRYKKTGCEGNFWLAIIPIAIAYGTGYGFFNLLYKSCGVRPADVLGIVQGMISSDLIDNPIVCVGTPN